MSSSSPQQRLSILPIKYPDVWEFYEAMLKNFWVPSEIDYSHDARDLQKMDDNIKHTLKVVLGFFNSSDVFVGYDILPCLQARVPDELLEAKFFYGLQVAVENVHSVTYSELIDSYFQYDAKQREELFNALRNFPIVSKKQAWVKRFFGEKEQSFATMLFAQILTEQIQFISSFCVIFWFQQQNFLPSLIQSNQLISRDESIHAQFGMHIYNNYLHMFGAEPLPEEVAFKMVGECCDIECEFAQECLKVDLIGINARQMNEFIKYNCDYILTKLRYKKKYGALQPFAFMNNLSI